MEEVDSVIDYIPPGYVLPRGEATPLGYRRFFINVAPGGSTISGQKVDVYFERPALVRLDSLLAATGAQYFPTAGEGIFYVAWPKDQLPSSDGTIALTRALRSTGPLLYIPSAGVWTITFQAVHRGTLTLTPIPITAEFTAFFLEEEVGAAYVQSPPSAISIGRLINIAAATNVPSIWGTGAFDLGTYTGGRVSNWFGCCLLRIQVNTTGAQDVRIAVGTSNAGAAVGGSLGSGVTRVYTWQELAGCNVSLFNNGAGAVDIWAEAHFI